MRTSKVCPSVLETFQNIDKIHFSGFNTARLFCKTQGRGDERWTGIEPATFSLGRRHSTAELPPHASAKGFKPEADSSFGLDRPLDENHTRRIFLSIAKQLGIIYYRGNLST